MKLIVGWLLNVILMITSAAAAQDSFVLGDPRAIVLDMKLEESSSRIIANLSNELQVWNYQTRTLEMRWTVAKVIAIDLRQNVVAGVSKNGTISTWSVSSGKLLMEKNIGATPLICITWFDDNALVVGGEDGFVYKINAFNGEVIAKHQQKSPITAIACTSNADIITGNKGGLITSYEGNALKYKYAIKGHRSWIRSIKASKKGVITSGDDGYYREWTSTLIETTNKKIGDWILSSDYIVTDDNYCAAFGESSGKVSVIFPLGKYTTKVKAMVNAIDIISDNTPEIVVAVGTHGNGIHVISAKQMDYSKK
ncbi:WD40 repeat domain-containing protein [Pseudochryseolinea flava]|uniref:WD40 repeat domain-containing protein n=1 Tax=Pseudochryseolinea flava TaxID=2059302 RepID=A0A364Y2N4_9BACT|nr:WD40 repeat domain-containing protein [Pseudochryseolinea flava]RAW00367.1 hypothetical protein DQQ10_15045 [Pseudochryseolinea flava]